MRNIDDCKENYRDSPFKKNAVQKILSSDLEGVEEMSEVVLRSITRVSREKVRKKFVEHNERAERIDLIL